MRTKNLRDFCDLIAASEALSRNAAGRRAILAESKPSVSREIPRPTSGFKDDNRLLLHLKELVERIIDRQFLEFREARQLSDSPHVAFSHSSAIARSAIRE